MSEPPSHHEPAPVVACKEEAERCLAMLKEYTHSDALSSSTKDALEEILNNTQSCRLVTQVAGNSPYLARLISRHPEWLVTYFTQPIENICEALSQPAEEDTEKGLMRLWRLRKSQFEIGRAHV